MAPPTADGKPFTLDLRPDNIPRELREQPHWLLWRWELRKNKWTKPPYQRNGRAASSTDPNSWTDFDTALAAYRRGRWDGVGFALHPERFPGLVAVDLDDVRDPLTGDVSEWGMNIVKSLNSYTEVSPSGTGLRILLRGTIPGERRVRGHFEVYCDGRYVTLTGHVLLRGAS